MPKNITKYSIFLGSPTDLNEERFEVEGVIKELNLTYGSRQNLVLELIKWETHSAPGVTHSYTQDLINNDIGNDYDIFIGILWQKFGTKTNIANSGTEEEFLNAIKRFQNKENIQILFYFKNNAPLSLDEINLEELSKIKKFKELLKENNVLYSSFNSLDELKANLRMHLPKRIDDLKIIAEKPVIEIDTESNNKDNLVEELIEEELILEEDLGYFDYLIEFESLLFKASTAINNINENTADIGKEFTRKAEEIQRIKKYPNYNKAIIIEIFKRTSNSIGNYSERLKLETSDFYNNFKDAIDIGLKYINCLEVLEKDQYIENLNSILQSTEGLYENMPSAIDGMSSFQSTVKSLPNIQSNLNVSKRKLDRQLEELIFSLKGARDLTNELINEIKYKLSKAL